MMFLLLLILCLLLAALIMLLLVALSVPIAKTIYLFRLVAQDPIGIAHANASATATFGAWGYCISTLQASTQFSGECSKAKLGYTFDSTVVNVLKANSIANSLSRTSTFALVLHPIACGFTFVAYLIAIYTYIQRRHVSRIAVKPPSRLLPVLLFTATFLATIVSLTAFAIDAGVIGVLRKTVYNDSDGLVTLTWGNGVWMTLGAAITLVFCLGCQWKRFGCCGRRD
ncbi:actin cortical patch SUR7/pH-response regulator pali [Scleroderma yunnanense]